MTENKSGLPMIKEGNKDLFDKLVALCNCSDYRCSKYKEFIRGYLEVNQLNIALSEMGLEEDLTDLIGYEISLECQVL